MAGIGLKLNNVRIVFPKIFKGQEEQFQGKGDPYFSASFLIDPKDPQVDVIKKAIRDAAFAKWGDKTDAMLKVFQGKDKLAIHDGDLRADKPYGAAYKGMLFVSARNNAAKGPAPAVFDNAADPTTGLPRVIDSANDVKAPYSGCYVNAKLNVFAYDQGGGQGVGASLLGIQFWKEGERLAGGGVAAADDFEPIPEQAGAQAAAGGKGAASLF